MKMTIGKKNFEVSEVFLKQSDLKFYTENPRIYSIMYANGVEPTQKEIEDKLKAMDHVRTLKSSIFQNGGLLNSLLVQRKGNDYIVLEGNSRLAAYRLLAEQDPLTWGIVKCNLLPDSITDADVFLLLGQEHIIGKKDWSVFEQAGYLYRTHKTTRKEVSTIASMLGIKPGIAQKQFEIYEYMVAHNDTLPTHWSYYEVLLRTKAFKKYLEVSPKFEESVINHIKKESFPAIDLRDKLGAIAKDKSKDAQKIVGRFVEGKATLDEAYEAFHDTGKDEDVYKLVRRFSEKITDDKFRTQIKAAIAAGNKELPYELRRVTKALDKLIKEIENKQD